MKMVSKENSTNEDYLSEAEYGVSPVDLSALMKAVLERKNSFRFTAKGWSMLPFIRDGDTLTISPLTGHVIGTGKIVAFKHSEAKKLVIHRILSRTRDGYLVKGDGLWGTDGVVSRENILGVVTRAERGGKETFWGRGFERHLITFWSRINVFFFLLEIWRFVPSPVKSFFRRE